MREGNSTWKVVRSTRWKEDFLCNYLETPGEYSAGTVHAVEKSSPEALVSLLYVSLPKEIT